MNNYIDYTGTKWLSAPHHEKFLAIVDMAKANKEQLYDAYKYLAGYHILSTKDMVKAQEYVDKAVAIKAEDPDGLKAMLNPGSAVPATPVVAPKVPVVQSQRLRKSNFLRILFAKPYRLVGLFLINDW